MLDFKQILVDSGSIVQCFTIALLSEHANIAMQWNAWFEPLKHLVLTKLPAFVSLPYSSPGRFTEQKDPRKTNKRPGKSIYIRDQLIVNVLSTLVIECACCPGWEHTGSHELTPRINNCLLSSLKRVDLFCVRAGKHLFSAYTALMQSHVQICKTFQYACMQGRRGGVQVGSKAASMDRKAIVVPRTNCLHFQDFINPCVNPFR